MVSDAFCVLFIFLAVFTASSVNGELRLVQVDREVDIKTSLVKISTRIKLENTGPDAENVFYHVIHSDNVHSFAYLDATAGLDQLSIVEKSNQVHFQNASKVFEIKLSKALNKGEMLNIELKEVLMNKIKAYPVEISQKDIQLVKYVDNVHYYSPYEILQEIVIVKMFNKQIEGYTRLQGVTNSVGGSQIRYGTFKNLNPFSYTEIYMHYENHYPFLLIQSLKRIIEVSHWGNIAVEEHVEMLHSGAKLKGPFSRYDYMTSSSSHSVKSFTAILPPGANNIYYRDMNGNISTSHVLAKKNHVLVELYPRFPLFGGWKTKYILGYNVPSTRYLFRNGNNFMLKFPFVDHVHVDMQIEKVDLSVRFPVGAKNIKVKYPFDLKKLDDGKYFNYMDSIGRTVLNFEKTNVVENHVKDIEIEYDRNQLFLFYEPVLVSGYILIMLVALVLFLNMNFSLGNSNKEIPSGNVRLTVPASVGNKKQK